MVLEEETLPMPPQGGQTVGGFVKFHHRFWIFRQHIDEIQYCKHAIQFDGTWLYDKYKGTLFVTVAQDDNNKIILIVFVVVDDETTKAWLFFLKNLKRHVTPQYGLWLISDRHKSIKSVYSRCDSRWTTQNSIHVFYIRQIAPNYMRRFKNNDIKLIINMGECQNSFSSY